MTFVFRLTGFTPGVRDDEPFVSARIEEGPTITGPWTTLSVVTLDPIDADPLNPMERSFTVANASAPDGLWYRITWIDAHSNVQPTYPIYHSASLDGAPTPDEIRALSPMIEWAEMGYAAGSPDPLRPVIDEAAVEFRGYTGLDVTTMDVDPGSPTYDPRAPLVRRALRMLVQYNVASSSQEILDTVADFDLLSAISAASISETRRSISANRQVIHPWPALNKLLTSILYFDSQGQPGYGVPAVDVVGPRPRPGREIMYEHGVGGHDYRVGQFGGPWPWSD
jgi:hypothetical protein